MRDRVAVWLDAVDENVKWLKYEVPPKERGKVIREALSLYRNGGKNGGNRELERELQRYRALAKSLQEKVKKLSVLVDDNTVIIGETVLSQIQLAFPDREVDDSLVQSILIRGIRSLKKEEEEREKAELLKSLKEV